MTRAAALLVHKAFRPVDGGAALRLAFVPVARVAAHLHQRATRGPLPEQVSRERPVQQGLRPGRHVPVSTLAIHSPSLSPVARRAAEPIDRMRAQDLGRVRSQRFRRRLESLPRHREVAGHAAVRAPRLLTPDSAESRTARPALRTLPGCASQRLGTPAGTSDTRGPIPRKSARPSPLPAARPGWPGSAGPLGQVETRAGRASRVSSQKLDAAGGHACHGQ